MRFRSFQTYLTFIALFTLCQSWTAAVHAADVECAPGHMKVLVVPFVNDAEADSLAALSFALAAHVSEAFESDPCIEPVTGEEFVLTEDIARLVTPRGKLPEGGMRPVANRIAREAGASHMLFTTFSGQVWDWTFHSTLCLVNDVADDLGNACAEGYANGSLVETVALPNGKSGQLQSAARLHALLDEAVQAAFTKSPVIRAVPITAETRRTIATPPYAGSREFYGELLLGRAYQRLFHFERPQQRQFAALKTWKTKAAFLKRLRKQETRYTALGLAAAAVRMDPAYAVAQRTFAALAAESKTLDNAVSKARLHYERALLARHPKANVESFHGFRPDGADYRTLLALGRLELGQGDAQTAQLLFYLAHEAQPQQAEPLFLRGTAYVQLMRAATGTRVKSAAKSAIEAFEAAIALDAGHMAARREVAALYSADIRHADAAAQFSEIVKLNPTDFEARFARAALLYVAGERTKALEGYHELCNEPEGSGLPAVMQASACKFAGDVRIAMALTPEVTQRYYARSAHFDPNDRRTKAVLAGEKTGLLGGDDLKQALTEAAEIISRLETTRARFQAAQNDAVMDLKLNGAEACKDGGGASSALLAAKQEVAYGEYRVRLSSLMREIGTAYQAGEGRAMVPVWSDVVVRGNVAMRKAARDAQELRAQRVRSLLPLYRRYACHKYDGPLSEATFDTVRARNGLRLVRLPEKPREAGAPMYFTPMIAADIARNVFISVDNRDGETDYVVRLAAAMGEEFVWRTVGDVPAGDVAEIPTRIGLYRVCVVPKDHDCGDDDAGRIAYLHDGWHMRIRSKR